MSESKHTRNERFLDALVEELQTMSDTDALEGENAESLVKLGNEILQEARYTARRIGPTEPDDTMVICPVCTSQFRAIPLDVQRQLAFLSAPERGERGTSRLGSESADERESTLGLTKNSVAS